MEVATAAGKGFCRSCHFPGTAIAELNGSERSTSCETIGFGRLWSEPLRYSSRKWSSSRRLVGGSNLAQISAVSGGKPSLGLEVGLRSNGNSLSSREFSSKCSSNAMDLGSRKANHRGIASNVRTGVVHPRSMGKAGVNALSIVEVEDAMEQDYRRVGVVDLNQALELLRQDVLYLDWRAKHDIYAIKSAHDKLVEVLNPTLRDQKSLETMRQQLAQLQEELARAHAQVHLSESRVEHSLRRLAEMDAAASSFKEQLNRIESKVGDETETLVAERSNVQATTSSSKQLNVSGRIAPYPSWLKNFWYPVAFTGDIDTDTLIPFESFEEPWVLFRGKDGRIGCVRDECAHRACPLSLGTVVEGQIQCPYHGWEYSTDGECKKMPSVRPLKASISALPCIEKDGMVWIWPGDETPSTVLPALNPPENFTIHAEIILELPVEHGLLMENLLDLAHAPFTHTSTFAKGWPIPSFVRFKTPTAALRGHWDPYPIDMEFQPPCMVLSTIGLVKPGQLDGTSTEACRNHLHQLHVCMPSTRGKTRLLYRMALDFAQWAKFVPFIDRLWVHLANQVLSEDLRLVEGQQNRMERGANVWQTPVAYDKLGVRYRRWRNAVEAGDKRLPFD